MAGRTYRGLVGGLLCVVMALLITVLALMGILLMNKSQHQPDKPTDRQYSALMAASPWYQWVNKTVNERGYTAKGHCFVCAGPSVLQGPTLVVPFKYNWDDCEAKKWRQSQIYQDWEDKQKQRNCTPETCQGGNPKCNSTAFGLNCADRILCSGNNMCLGSTKWTMRSECNEREPTCTIQCLAYKMRTGSNLVGRFPKPISCKHVHWPLMKSTSAPPAEPVIAEKQKYFCYTKNYIGGTPVGHFPRCYKTIYTSYQACKESWVDPSYFQGHKYALADVWWMCGNSTLYPTLPTDWAGTCAQVMYVRPMTIYHKTTATRTKREITSTTGLEKVWFGVLGEPEGVPREHAALDDAGHGALSFFCPWCEMGVHTKWINFIYYTEMVYQNLTREALQSLKEELNANTRVTLQNRAALDYLLAKEGGVCALMGDQCCTYIPNNSEAGGEVDNIMQHMHAVSATMERGTKHVDTLGWLKNLFSGWTGPLFSAGIVIVIVLVLLMICGCCGVPIMQGMINRLIQTSPAYQALNLEESDCCKDREYTLEGTFMA